MELERTLAAFGAETLTPDEAARLSGYSPDYIRKQIAAGDLPNAGRKNAPRVCRGGHDSTWLTASGSSIASRRRGPAARAGRRGADR